MKYTQYYSKWRKQWIDIGREMTDGEVKEYLKYHYKLK